MSDITGNGCKWKNNFIYCLKIHNFVLGFEHGDVFACCRQRWEEVLCTVARDWVCTHVVHCDSVRCEPSCCWLCVLGVWENCFDVDGIHVGVGVGVGWLWENTFIGLLKKVFRFYAWRLAYYFNKKMQEFTEKCGLILFPAFRSELIMV